MNSHANTPVSDLDEVIQNAARQIIILLNRGWETGTAIRWIQRRIHLGPNGWTRALEQVPHLRCSCAEFVGDDPHCERHGHLYRSR